MDGLRRRGAASMAKAYLSNKKEEIEMSMRRKFGSNSDRDLEAQNPLVDEFHDETTADAAAKRRSDHSFITRIVLIVAGCTVATNVVVMVGCSATVALLAGLFAAAVSITVAVVQLKLEDMETLREVQNEMRKDVNRFSAENNRLGVAIQGMIVELVDLKQTEQRLQELTKEQDITVQSLVGLVEESKQFTEQMKEVVRLDLISELMDVVLKGEKDESGTFSDKEIRRLVVYMRGLPAVKVNEELLEKAIRKDRSMVSLINMVLDIYREGDQEGDRIFVIDDEDVELQTRFISTY